MIDTWSTVGSCAQIGKRVHISGGVGIGGVLEPLQAEPVIIEDDCFIGARSEVAEGVIVRKGAVLAMGVFLGASTKIVDRATGEIFCRRGSGIFGRGARRPARQAAAERPARPVDRLRRDHEARRRAHPLQDQHQRAAAGLGSNRGLSRATNVPDLGLPPPELCAWTGPGTCSASTAASTAPNCGSEDWCCWCLMMALGSVIAAIHILFGGGTCLPVRRLGSLQAGRSRRLAVADLGRPPPAPGQAVRHVADDVGLLRDLDQAAA